MPNRQIQDQQNQVRQNPGVSLPDDDDAAEFEQNQAAGLDRQDGGQRDAQDAVTEIEDEEAEDDEDEDGLGAPL